LGPRAFCAVGHIADVRDGRRFYLLSGSADIPLLI
jgi:hypothetical protein